MDPGRKDLQTAAPPTTSTGQRRRRSLSRSSTFPGVLGVKEIGGDRHKDERGDRPSGRFEMPEGIGPLIGRRQPEQKSRNRGVPCAAARRSNRPQETASERA